VALWFEGAITGSYNDEMAMLLYVLIANGLDGDVRVAGDTPGDVELIRGLLLGAGSCAAIDPPTDAALYRPGDECYRQHAEARAFVDPRPRNGEPSPPHRIQPRRWVAPPHTSMIDTIAFEEGDEFAPDAPWGAERLTLSSGGAFTYERRHLGSTEGCRGTVDLAIVRRIEELIAAAGFPQIPDHRLPPGASAVTLTVMTPDVEPTSLTFDRYFAEKVPGYGDLVDVLAGLDAALRSKDPAQIRAAGLTLE